MATKLEMAFELVSNIIQKSPEINININTVLLGIILFIMLKCKLPNELICPME